MQPWHWSVGGALIALTMVLLLLIGRRFGVSSNFDTLCSIGGAGRINDYFRIDVKKRLWGLVFVAGSIVGGWIAMTYFNGNGPVDITEDTLTHLGLAQSSASGLIPVEIFNWDDLFTTRNVILLLAGGFLVGFGTRYAGGCTSGHAISGLSNLQLPSLIAVIGFFIGGLLMTWFILPEILKL